MRTTLTLHDSRFLKACRREPVDCTPVWFMRQAGRYMSEYRDLREKHGFLGLVKTPELATEVTLQPIRAYDVDAGIIFSDLPPLLEGMGLHLTYEQGEGPVIHNPLRARADIEALRITDPHESLGYTIEAVRLVTRELADKVPLIGFSGAPFTLATYAIEGGSSRDFRRSKLLMYREPDTWHLLMDKLATVVSHYLVAQIEAGASAVQLFDSWVGSLAPGDYAEYVLPHVQRCVATVKEQGVPVIYFGTTTSGMFPTLRHIEADVIGVDWRIPLDEAWAQLGPGFAVQGNLDPMALFAPWPEIERRAADILARAAGRPGHIFNLGHGILTETPVEHVARLTDFVHQS